jgi:hypothetical protein
MLKKSPKNPDKPSRAQDQKIIKEGGYQPTTDPGPVPTSLIRPADTPAGKPEGK